MVVSGVGSDPVLPQAQLALVPVGLPAPMALPVAAAPVPAFVLPASDEALRELKAQAGVAAPAVPVPSAPTPEALSALPELPEMAAPEVYPALAQADALAEATESQVRVPDALPSLLEGAYRMASAPLQGPGGGGVAPVSTLLVMAPSAVSPSPEQAEGHSAHPQSTLNAESGEAREAFERRPPPAAAVEPSPEALPIAPEAPHILDLFG